MSPTAFPRPALPPFDAVVARLRAAGCVFAEDEAKLLVAGAADPAELEAVIDRRAAGLPLEHILGWAEFCGLRIAVDDRAGTSAELCRLLSRYSPTWPRSLVNSIGMTNLLDGLAPICAQPRRRWRHRAGQPGPSSLTCVADQRQSA